MPAAELCDRPVTVEQVWGRPPIAELRDRLATADGPHEMLTLLEEELTRRLCETTGLGLVRHTSRVIAAASGAVAIGDLSVAAGVSSTHLAQRFNELIGVTPKRLARTCRFAATVFAISPAGPIGWGDLAGGAGYFGQAHFGHEFRAFTALTPTRYGEVRRRFLPRTSRPRAGRLAAAGRLISYQSDNSRPTSLGAPPSKGEPRGQGGYVQLGVGGRLRRGRE
jgi:AraC-like DNA-binding protein